MMWKKFQYIQSSGYKPTEKKKSCKKNDIDFVEMPIEANLQNYDPPGKFF